MDGFLERLTASLVMLLAFAWGTSAQQDSTAVQYDTTSIFSVVEVLDEAVATAEKTRVVYRLDRQTLSADANLSAAGGTAVDVLKAIPS